MDKLVSQKVMIESIDKKIEAICEENDLTVCQEETAYMCREWFLDEIAKVPSVPAVPLDKLCEWLAEYAAPPVTECCVTSDERTAAWKAVLNKFVEEQDAAD